MHGERVRTQQERAGVVAWALVTGIELNRATAARLTGLNGTQAWALVELVRRFLAEYETGERQPETPRERAAALVAMLARGQGVRMAEAAERLGLTRQGGYCVAWNVARAAPVYNAGGVWRLC